MTDVIFNDKVTVPDDELLREHLGDSFIHWKHIIDFTQKNFSPIREEWKFYGKKYGWQHKIFLKKRNLFFLIPASSWFKVVFIFGDKAVQPVEKSTVSEALKKQLLEAKKYMEGRGMAIDVRDETFLPDIEQLISIKINN